MTDPGLMVIHDGYTLTGKLSGEGRPDVEIRYRPALPDALYDYQLARANAKTGEEVLNAQVALLEAHVIGWSGVYRATPTGPVPVPWTRSSGKVPGVLGDPAVLLALTADYLTQMVNYVASYTAGELWEGEIKNS